MLVKNRTDRAGKQSFGKKAAYRRKMAAVKCTAWGVPCTLSRDGLSCSTPSTKLVANCSTVSTASMFLFLISVLCYYRFILHLVY